MKIKIKCAWCQISMGTKESGIWDSKMPPVTHSICSACREQILKTLFLQEEQQFAMVGVTTTAGTPWR